MQFNVDLEKIREKSPTYDDKSFWQSYQMIRQGICPRCNDPVARIPNPTSPLNDDFCTTCMCIINWSTTEITFER